tara:strand:- start:261 stop:374 length:114 start_codon:yes stop_codon:yes gene_type:complete
MLLQIFNMSDWDKTRDVILGMSLIQALIWCMGWLSKL